MPDRPDDVSSSSLRGHRGWARSLLELTPPRAKVVSLPSSLFPVCADYPRSFDPIVVTLYPWLSGVGISVASRAAKMTSSTGRKLFRGRPARETHHKRFGQACVDKPSA
jgi:hypothetical protein